MVWLLIAAGSLTAMSASAMAQEAAAEPDPAVAAGHVQGAPDPRAGPEAAHAVPDVHWGWMLPFALLLGSIAVMPLVRPHFWEHYYPWFAISLGAVTGAYYLFFFDVPGAPAAWLHEMQEYISFIALLGSLYIVSGGIVIHVSRDNTPATNTLLLLIGALIANVFGTTGAAMLLIRPYLRINRGRIKPYHVVFFIFIVANVGGALTPIGDPPLFMGYLKGVPFFWVAEALWPMWAVCVALLLVVFYFLDRREHRRSIPAGLPPADKGAGARETQKAFPPPAPEKEAVSPTRAVEIFGARNFLFIGLILFAVFQPSMFALFHEAEYARLIISREVLMLIAALASRLSTGAAIYDRNEFRWGPIKEVAILFVGIFSTMVPALNYLNHHADQMPLRTAGQYYFMTGTLSAVLDNAPTYLVFLETKQGQVQKEYTRSIDRIQQVLNEHEPGRIPELPADAKPDTRGAYETLIRYKASQVKAGRITDADIRIAMIISDPKLASYLIAISIGAVFFGACTYIGNGPNFMVKSIAESAGIAMPSFFGYVVRYTLPVLVPIYVLIWLLFFVLG